MRDFNKFKAYFKDGTLNSKDNIIFFYLNRKILYFMFIISSFGVSINYFSKPIYYESKCVLLTSSNNVKKNTLLGGLSEINSNSNDDLQNVYNVDFFTILLNNSTFLNQLLQSNITYKNTLIRFDDYIANYSIINNFDFLRYKLLKYKRPKITVIKSQEYINIVKKMLTISKDDNLYTVSVRTDDKFVTKQILKILIDNFELYTINLKKQREQEKLNNFKLRIIEQKKLLNESLRKLSEYKDLLFNVNLESIKTNLLILQNDFNINQATYNSLVTQYDQFLITTKNAPSLFTIFEPISEPIVVPEPSLYTLLLLAFVVSAIFFTLSVIFMSYIVKWK
jgi:hypothetical protein